MAGETRFRLGLSIGLVLAGLVLALAAAVPSEQKGKPKDDGVLYPPDRAVLLSGSFDVICTTDQNSLAVDGKAREWEPFQPPLRVAHVRLSPGMHEIRIGDRRREVVVALNEEEYDAPRDWAVYRHHEMKHNEQGCADCHQTGKQNGRITVGELKSYEACFECHEPVDFDVIHSHPLDPIEHCEICHALHGSPRKALLKAPVKKLCADCHDA